MGSNVYEEEQTITLAGPGPLQAKQIHQWLTTPKHVIHQETGRLISVMPPQNWNYMKQVLENDLYNDLGLVVLWNQVRNNDITSYTH